MPNRYEELSEREKRHVNGYVNSIASKGDTQVARDVKYWSKQARERFTNNCRLAKLDDELAADLFPAHEIAMIVHSTVAYLDYLEGDE